MDKKKHLLSIIAVVALLILLAIGVKFTFLQSVELRDQESFLQNNNYLSGSKKAIASYLAAVEELKKHKITNENRKEVTEKLFREEVLTNVFPHFREGAKQKKLGMPRMRYYNGTVEVEGEKIVDTDLYLCSFYIRSLLDADYPVDEHECAMVCLAFGVQLSAYRTHEVLYSNAIACKWKALQKLKAIYKQNGNVEKAEEASRLFAEVEREYRAFQGSLKE